ncbi:ovarian cancer G-protein coupled receptor 1-like isoform X1 [Dicentrarchus labrax]|uniref:G-protein coupled receptors family 1 profile domain-containing protein n=1 Tax=Dicentrarchus labrax TaxID=13489 RepID=A0A8P4FYI2_DICLA|nr:ovarian cancer G-protein coupled receptor 1-like isoform X1 [Dicentrarchus labrax]
MEDLYINTSQDKIYDYSNFSFDYEYHNNVDMIYYYEYKKLQFIMHVVTCIIICIGLPSTLVAIYAVYSQVRNDHVAPIYVINLLISDLIQLCSFIVMEAQSEKREIVALIVNNFGVAASVGFMACVSLERYLVIACPLWYRFRRTIKTSVVVSVMVWALILVVLLTFYFWVHPEITDTVFGIFLLLPLPVFIFFLGGILKALSASRVPSDEKRRIVGILVLVLLIYTLLFLPRIIYFLTYTWNYIFDMLSLMFVKLSPLADLVLYVFMRKGTIDKVLASVCCKMDSNDISSSTTTV